jgi:hypothetical protein
MSMKLTWDKVGERFYETGVDRGVLYIPDVAGVYALGHAWNGLVSVTESPSGADANPQYADNIKYLNLVSAEEFGGTIEAFTYPDEFGECDGTAMPEEGISLGQQRRKSFGLSYRSKVGNDLDGNDHGYKLHLVYGAMAAPSEKAYSTINDSPSALTFSWTFTTTPVSVAGFKPTATLSIDSTKVSPAALTAIEEALYGGTAEPRLPLPSEILSMVSADPVKVAIPAEPKYSKITKTITVTPTDGVAFHVDGDLVTDKVVIEGTTVITADPVEGYRFPEGTTCDWTFPVD